jgi:hypothetical protein
LKVRKEEKRKRGMIERKRQRKKKKETIKIKIKQNVHYVKKNSIAQFIFVNMQCL